MTLRHIHSGCCFFLLKVCPKCLWSSCGLQPQLWLGCQINGGASSVADYITHPQNMRDGSRDMAPPVWPVGRGCSPGPHKSTGWVPGLSKPFCTVWGIWQELCVIICVKGVWVCRQLLLGTGGGSPLPPGLVQGTVTKSGTPRQDKMDGPLLLIVEECNLRLMTTAHIKIRKFHRKVNV